MLKGEEILHFKKNNVLIFFILNLVFIGILTVTIPFNNLKRSDFLVMTTFVINGCIWMALLFNEIKKRAFSLAFMHWCFCLFFFFFVAIVQYTNDKFPWVGYISDSLALNSNLTLLLYTLFVWLGNSVEFLKLNIIKKYMNKNFAINRFPQISLCMLILIAFWRILNVGLANLLSRSTSSYAISDNMSMSMLFSHSMEAVAYFSALFCLIYLKKNYKSIIYIGIVCLIILLAYPPTGLARYKAAAIYLGLLLTISDNLKITRKFSLLFIFGFILILPFLNIFRNDNFVNISLIYTISEITNNISMIWLAGDYDSYTMLSLAINYVDVYGMDFGYQLLGAIFFWIPRQIWINKAIGSGAEIAESVGLNFTNISCPLPAEMMLAFSYFGIIILGFFVGNIIRFFDRFYWKEAFGMRRINFIYPVIVIFFFFLCRGDLLSSFAYLSAFAIIYIIYLKVYDIIKKSVIK